MALQRTGLEVLLTEREQWKTTIRESPLLPDSSHITTSKESLHTRTCGIFGYQIYVVTLKDYIYEMKQKMQLTAQCVSAV